MTLLLALLTLTTAFADDIDLHDPTYYPVLAKNSKLDCRYASDDNFGFLFERGETNDIRVSLITNNVNEGDKSAFVAVIKNEAHIGFHLYHYSRKGDFGTFIEFELRNQRNPRLGYRFSGLAMMVSAIYSKDENGNEKEELYPDFSRTIACQIL